jgi:hypothetical protein
MDDFHKPRHIRDIAHLYISRMSATDEALPKHVYVIGTARECFAGYHAANVALCIAQKGHAVQLVEVSGTIPCSAYFLRLPPQVYLKQKLQHPEDSVSGLGGVTVRFALPSASQPRGSTRAGIATGLRRRSAGAVDVFHLPPVDELESLEGIMEEVSGIPGSQKCAVVLAPNQAEAVDAGRGVFGRRPAIQWKTLSLVERRYGPGEVPAGAHSLGYLVGWRSLLADPLPCVVRDPDSHVSRSYASVCDALLAPASAIGRRYERKAHRGTASHGRVR